MKCFNHGACLKLMRCDDSYSQKLPEKMSKNIRKCLVYHVSKRIITPQEIFITLRYQKIYNYDTQNYIIYNDILLHRSAV